MNKASYFLEEKALFGSFPTQDEVTELEQLGVRWFINLTHSTESKITSYITRYNYIEFPIRDGFVPSNQVEFCKFIIQVKNIIQDLESDQKIYVHCKGGHGRSGVVVAVLLGYILSISPYKSLQLTNHYHSLRPIMRERWRKLGSPQTIYQKNYVIKTLIPIYLNNIPELLPSYSQKISINSIEYNNILEAFEDLSKHNPSTNENTNYSLLLNLYKSLINTNKELYTNLLHNTRLRSFLIKDDENQSVVLNTDLLLKVLNKIREDIYTSQ